MSLYKNILSGLLVLWTTNVCSEPATTISIVTEHWPPFNYLNEQGEADGISTQLVKQVMEEAGLQYHIKLLSWKRAYKSAKNNPNVLIYTIYRLKSREPDFQWICPLIKTGGIKFFALKSRADININQLSDAKKYSTATIGTGWTHDYLKFNGFKVGKHLDIGTDELANIRKLFQQRIDLIIQTEELVQVRLKKLGKNRNDLAPAFSIMTNEHKNGCMAMSIDTSSEIINAISLALAKVKARQ